MPTLSQIAQGEQQSANRANDERFNTSLKNLKDARRRMTLLFEAARTQMAGVGQQAGVDINTGAAQQQATQTQGLMTAGLGNTTIRGAMSRGVEQDRTAAQARLSEGIAGQQAGLYAQQAQAEFGGAQAMSNLYGQRQDLGPDMGQMAGLARAGAGAGSGFASATGPFSRNNNTGGGGGGGGAPYASTAPVYGSGGEAAARAAPVEEDVGLIEAGTSRALGRSGERLSIYHPAFPDALKQGWLEKKTGVGAGYYYK